MSTLLLLALLLGAGWAWTPDLPRAELEARYAPAPSRFVEAGGQRWHVRDTGPTEPSALATSPAVLMLHGFGSSLHTWEAWAQALQARHRVVRVDLPGSGLTGPDPAGRYDDEHALAQLLALMDTLGLARASLVGHSMGGRLAWRLAAAQPQRVHKLVLLAPDGFASPGFDYGKPPEVGWLASLLPHVLPRVALRAGLAPAYADPARLSEDTVTRYHQLLLAPGVRGAILDRLRQLRLEDPAPLLARVQAPTLLVWGERDAMIPAAHAQDYLRALPPAARAQLQLLPGLGHLPQEEDPQAGLAALLAFLDDRQAGCRAQNARPAVADSACIQPTSHDPAHMEDPGAMQIDRLDHLVLTVANIDASCDFYSRVLGMRVTTFAGDRKALHFGRQKINLHEQGRGFEPKAAQPAPGSADLCFITQVPLADVIAHLRREQVAVLEGPVARTGAMAALLSVYFRDPDGNLVEVSNEAGAATDSA